MPLIWLLLLSLFGTSLGCLKDPASAYRFTGIVCRLTHPAAVVLNEKTTKVIEAAFQHARYPSMKGEKSLLLTGKVLYGLQNLEIHNLSIGRSEFELRPGEGVGLKISNVSAIFRGTLEYGYGSWLVNVGHSVDFEVESQIDLGINPKLYCGNGKVAADTSDCYLTFHKLNLLLQGDREPNWLKKIFTNFITFTVKMVVKAQICKEINKAATVLADFIQGTAERFLSDGDISVNINLTAAPIITPNYIESYHKGLNKYHNVTTDISESVFHPSQLTEHRMLYFWFSDQVFNPLVSAAHHDGRFQLNISGAEFTDLFKANFSNSTPEFFNKCLLESASPELRVWSSSVPSLKTSSVGTTVWAEASGELYCGNPHTPTLSFKTEVITVVNTFYADKKVFLKGNASKVSVIQAVLSSHSQQLNETLSEFIKEAVETIGVPKVLSVLQVEITRLLDQQGANLFDILNPEVLPHEGFVVIQMDFGFPHHLLVEFLSRTLQ